MQNQSAAGAGRFTMYSDGAVNYATFTKYGSTYAGSYVVCLPCIHLPTYWRLETMV
ncbi:MAG: hypothetical protein HWD58_10380 [Bacteroidota bacterium]|nr:MAG: hypothetical protein HWD58_10380 [Bacteroidota bacterium]